MKIKNLPFLPKEYSYCRMSQLDNDYIKRLEEKNIKEIRYFYAEDSYEGAGHMLYLLNKLWYRHDMSHCSCYGPIDNLNPIEGFLSLKDLFDNCSKELQEEIKPLINL